VAASWTDPGGHKQRAPHAALSRSCLHADFSHAAAGLNLDLLLLLRCEENNSRRPSLGSRSRSEDDPARAQQADTTLLVAGHSRSLALSALRSPARGLTTTLSYSPADAAEVDRLQRRSDGRCSEPTGEQQLVEECGTERGETRGQLVLSDV
jgi:hypothetical protein